LSTNDDRRNNEQYHIEYAGTITLKHEYQIMINQESGDKNKQIHDEYHNNNGSDHFFMILFAVERIGNNDFYPYGNQSF